MAGLCPVVRPCLLDEGSALTVSCESATRFNASIKGVRVFDGAVAVADKLIEALVVLDGRVVAGALCRMWDIFAVPLRVADLVR